MTLSIYHAKGEIVTTQLNNMEVTFKERHVGKYRLFATLTLETGYYVVDLIIYKGRDSEDINSEDIVVQVIDKNEKALHMIQKPPFGPLPEYGGPGFSAYASYKFKKSAEINTLKTMIVKMKEDIIIYKIDIKRRLYHD